MVTVTETYDYGIIASVICRTSVSSRLNHGDVSYVSAFQARRLVSSACLFPACSQKPVQTHPEIISPGNVIRIVSIWILVCTDTHSKIMKCVILSWTHDCFILTKSGPVTTYLSGLLCQLLPKWHNTGISHTGCSYDQNKNGAHRWLWLLPWLLI